jgi:cytochrome c-type biogenesis protein CcmH
MPWPAGAWPSQAGNHPHVVRVHRLFLMLIFGTLAALLVVSTLAALLWPLLRGRHGTVAPDADSAAIALYRDQKQALDAECADGVITPAERDTAVAELARRLGDELAVAPGATAGGSGERRAWVVSLALLLLVPSAAVVLYARLGNPNASAVSAAASDASQGHEMSESQITAMVENLAQRLQAHPDEAEGWVLLARSYAALGRYAEAAKAYARADALIPDNADLLADYADALAMAQGKQLAGKPAELARRALTLDPQHRKALALSATAAMEAHDLDGALTYWRRLLAQLPEGSEDARQVGAIVAEVESARRDGPVPAVASSKGPRRNDQAAAAPAPGGATIAGRVDIAPSLAAQVSLSDTVFIFARAVDGSRMPLAVLRVPARELPKQFRLDDSMGMAPGVKLSSAAAVIVEARISKSGNALPQPGDLSGRSAPVKPGASDVKITIDQVVP